MKTYKEAHASPVSIEETQNIFRVSIEL